MKANEEAREALVERLAEAIDPEAWDEAVPLWQLPGADREGAKKYARMQARAVLPVVAAEVEAAVSVVRAQVERANQHADEWAATADRWTHRAAENGRRAKAAEADLRALLEERDSLKEAVEYALHLRMYGERAPGGDETWGKWESMAETTLRSLPAPSAPVSSAEAAVSVVRARVTDREETIRRLTSEIGRLMGQDTLHINVMAEENRALREGGKEEG